MAIVATPGEHFSVPERVIKSGNVVPAEIATHELGGLGLAYALELAALVALKNRKRSRRVAAWWLQRWSDETAGATIADFICAAGCFAALGGPRHEQALAALREFADPARR